MLVRVYSYYNKIKAHISEEDKRMILLFVYYGDLSVYVDRELDYYKLGPGFNWKGFFS